MNNIYFILHGFYHHISSPHIHFPLGHSFPGPVAFTGGLLVVCSFHRWPYMSVWACVRACEESREPARVYTYISAIHDASISCAWLYVHVWITDLSWRKPATMKWKGSHSIFKLLFLPSIISRLFCLNALKLSYSIWHRTLSPKRRKERRMEFLGYTSRPHTGHMPEGLQL